MDVGCIRVLGVLAGILIRKVVPAIVTALVAYFPLAIATGAWLRAHYLAADRRQGHWTYPAVSVGGEPGLDNQRRPGRSASRRCIRSSRAHQRRSPGKEGGGPNLHALVAWQYLVQHGYTRGDELSAS